MNPDPTPEPGRAPAAAPSATSAPAARWLALLADSLAQGSFVKLRLGRQRAAQPGPGDLLGVEVRRISLRDTDRLSFTYRHATRDVTRNLTLDDSLSAVRDALRSGFEHAHLLTRTHDIQWSISRKGRQSVRRGRRGDAQASPGTEPAAAADDEPRLVAHDRAKRRYIDPQRPFLAALGVTDAQHQVVPAMSRKWKQINKFVEILDHAIGASPLAQRSRLRVLDFGCGKGYLTFAVHEHVSRALGRDVQVVGVELRDALVRECNAIVQRLGLDGLAFEQGDVRHYAPGAIDVMIALHACDTATDHAIALGVRAGAAIIMCSPCCHKELRPQMRSPAPLQPLLRHGIHMAQAAEMVTDALRALLLEAEGYATQVFEFVALEHTSKNKMILAVKRETPAPRDELRRQIADLKAFFGVREQCLETLLAAPADQCETMQAAG